jgi:DnaK suppressor protein
MFKKLGKTFSLKEKTKLEQDKTKILLQIDALKKYDPFSDPDHASDNAAVDTDVREQVGHETVEAEIKDLRRRLSDIDLALKKVGKNSFGHCEKCDKLIPKARLELVPEARFCIDCEKILRK